MILAVKCAQSKEQLEKALSIAQKHGLYAIEIQEVFDIMEKIPTEKRAELVIKYLKNSNITHLAYHFPVKSRWDSIEEAKCYDLAWGSEKIINLSKEVIREATTVAYELELDSIVPVNFHLFRFVERNKISKEEKEQGLKIGESALLRLKSYADSICEELGLLRNEESLIQITRENNPPDHGLVDGLLDYHPLEIIRTSKYGIKNCLDFAHFQQYINYLKNGKGELPGVDLDREYYPTDINWKFAIDTLKENIIILHINDAHGYRKEYEGLEVGSGEINYREIFQLLQNLKNPEIICTIEIKDGHIHWWKIENSIIKVREYLSNKE